MNTQHLLAVLRQLFEDIGDRDITDVDRQIVEVLVLDWWRSTR